MALKSKVNVDFEDGIFSTVLSHTKSKAPWNQNTFAILCRMGDCLEAYHESRAQSFMSFHIIHSKRVARPVSNIIGYTEGG